MTGFIRSSYVHVGATASATIVALGLVTVPPERYDSVVARTEFAAVQLQAVVATQVAALVNTAPNDGTVAADPSAFTGNSALTPSAAATAAASTVGDALTSVGRIALNALGTLLSPIWWLAFPITLQLKSLYGSSYTGIPILNVIQDFYNWLGFPSRLGEYFFPSSTPVVAAATREAASAMVTPESDASEALSLSDTSVTTTEPAATAIDAVAAFEAARASAIGGGDFLASLGRLAFNVVGALLAPIWWLGFPVTFELKSTWGYVESLSWAGLTPPLFALQESFSNIAKWFNFPFRLGESLFPSSTPVVAAAQRAATPRVAEVTAGQTANASATVPAPAAETTEAVASNNKRQRAATARAREVVQPTATASSVIAANTPEAINTPAAAAPSVARKSRIERANRNTANADSGKRIGRATAAAQ